MANFDELRDFPFFSGLGRDELTHVLPAVHRRQVAAGTFLFQAGDPPVGFYLVVSGRVKVFRESADGQEQALGFFGPGESFAEAALFQEGYPASAITLDDSELFLVQRDTFIRQLGDNPSLALRVIVTLSTKQRRLVRLLEDLTLRDARGRFCHYLAQLLDDHPQAPVTVALPVAQVTLARLLGVTEETLSRTIRSLRKDGILGAAEKGQFVVENVEQLKKAYSI
ncbi:MAG: Crp/Fnr family transcriptional regulator [Vulcanimicrobiota bacterium]